MTDDAFWMIALVVILASVSCTAISFSRPGIRGALASFLGIPLTGLIANARLDHSVQASLVCIVLAAEVLVQFWAKAKVPRQQAELPELIEGSKR